MNTSSQPVLQSLLLVDDDQSFRRTLAKALRRRGKTVYEAETAEQAQEFSSLYELDGAVLDLRMPGESGLSIIEPLKARYPDIRIVMLTGYGSIPNAVEAMRLGAFNYLTKPADTNAVLAALSQASPQPVTTQPESPSLAEVEWNYIQQVLHQCDGNISRAAASLGMHRRSLQRKLARHSSGS